MTSLLSPVNAMWLPKTQMFKHLRGLLTPDTLNLKIGFLFGQEPAEAERKL